jgi:hypothetical protein
MACTVLYLSALSKCLFSYDELDFQFSEGLAHKPKSVNKQVIVYSMHQTGYLCGSEL